MRTARSSFALRARLAVVAAVLLAGTALAQTPALPAGQVSGGQLSQWLGQKFSYAGLHMGSKCAFMNSGGSSNRVLFMSCPNGWSAKIEGTARVVGDTLCTNFAVPNTPPGEECLSWHATGDGRYEQRNGAKVSTVLYVLPAP